MPQSSTRSAGPPRFVAVLLAASAAACGARSALSDEAYSTPVLYCPGEGYTVRPDMPAILVAGVPRHAIGRVLWAVLASPPGARVTLTPNADGTVVFRASTSGVYEVRVSIPSPPPRQGDGGASDGGSSEGSSCTIRVTVRANGPTAICPLAVTVAPLQATELTGSAQGDRAIESYRWSLESAALGSSRPDPTPRDRATTRFTPDVGGEYRLRLRVTDEAGASDSCVTTVRAQPREGLRVEMYWDPPGRTCPDRPHAACDRSDVDLHLLRTSAGRGWSSEDDCNWQNCNVSSGRLLAWDGPGPEDDPRLDIDWVDGHGPENINIDRPASRSYRVGVHYYASHGALEQAAHVVIYCGGATAVARFGPVTLTERPGGNAENDFWIVADVLPLPNGGGCEVRPIRRGGAPYIVRWSDARTDPGPPPPP